MNGHPKHNGEHETRIRARLAGMDPLRRHGRIVDCTGTVLRARLPEAFIGERCRIRRRRGMEMTFLSAEVVGFDDAKGVILMPLGPVEGISLDDEVLPEERPWLAPCGEGVRGRILDALGEPIDGLGPLSGVTWRPLSAAPPSAMRRTRITEPLSTGVRALDGLLTLGRGQRVGIFAPAGGGKSTLLAMLARRVEADAVVLALIGERGREVAPFVEDNLGSEGLARSAVVVSTSDEPAIRRLKAAYLATTIAEGFRRQGARVVLLMDSVTRFARALREVGLAAGELPTRRGFPPSVFAELPRLFERTGHDEHGSITAFYTVLLEGELADDPVGEETRSLLDGHIILSERLAARQHYPAIDVLASKSRLMSELLDGERFAEHRQAATVLLRCAAIYEEHRTKIEMGLYEPGSVPAVDTAITLFPRLEAFLCQRADEAESFDVASAKLAALIRGVSL